MKIPAIDLFYWMLNRYQHAKYILSFSNSDGLSYEQFKEFTGYRLPDDFDFGWDSHFGSDALNTILQKTYNCKRENIVNTCGGTEANFLVFLSLLDRKSEIIIEKPGYEPLWKTPHLLKAQPVFWERKFEDEFTIDINRLQSLITKKTKMIVLTNLHNPSGVLLSRNKIKEISKLALDHDITVLVDEIFLDGVEEKYQSSWGLPNVIITSSVAKIHGLCGLRSGWIIASEHLTRELLHAKAHTTIASPYLSETITAQALNHAKPQLITRFQKKAKENKKIVSEWIEKNTDIIDWVPPDAGIICFPKYHISISSIALSEYLFSKYKVLISPGEFFNQESHLRLGFGIDAETLSEGLHFLAKGIREKKNV